MTAQEEKILAIDIGGSHIKATILNEKGDLQMDYEKTVTPSFATPVNIVKAIQELVKEFPPYDKVSVGFPGYVKNGVIKTAPHLGTEQWKDIDLNRRLGEALVKPVRVVNDADFQGLGLATGNGFEMIITLGTGFGTAFVWNGKLLPHLEIAHHPFTKKRTYDDYIGDKEMKRIGNKKWNRRMQEVLQVLKTVFNYDHLYISGGNAVLINFKLDSNITIDSNKDGIKGGAMLWK